MTAKSNKNQTVLEFQYFQNVFFSGWTEGVSNPLSLKTFLYSSWVLCRKDDGSTTFELDLGSTLIWSSGWNIILKSAALETCWNSLLGPGVWTFWKSLMIIGFALFKLEH